MEDMPGKGKCWLVACSVRGDGDVPPMRLRKGLLEPNVKLEGEGCRSAVRVEDMSVGQVVLFGWEAVVAGG